MSSLVADLRFALRLFWKRPGFTLLILMVLGIGVGANASIFGLVKQVLLRPLPFVDPDQLVRVSGTNRNGTGPLSYPDFVDLRERSRVFSGVALIDDSDPILTGGGEPREIDGKRVSPAYLSVLGIEPALGRFFAAEEETFGNHLVMVLGHQLWRDRFGSDPGIIGREVDLWGSWKYVVVGVMPPDFEDADVAYATRPQFSGALWRSSPSISSATDALTTAPSRACARARPSRKRRTISTASLESFSRNTRKKTSNRALSFVICTRRRSAKSGRRFWRSPCRWL